MRSGRASSQARGVLIRAPHSLQQCWTRAREDWVAAHSALALLHHALGEPLAPHAPHYSAAHRHSARRASTARLACLARSPHSLSLGLLAPTGSALLALELRGRLSLARPCPARAVPGLPGARGWGWRRGEGRVGDAGKRGRVGVVLAGHQRGRGARTGEGAARQGRGSGEGGGGGAAGV